MLQSLTSVGNQGISEASLASAFTCDIAITSIAPKGFKVFNEDGSNKKLKFLGVTEDKTLNLVDAIKLNISKSDGIIVIYDTYNMSLKEKQVKEILDSEVGTKPLLEMELTDLDYEEDVLRFIFTNKVKHLYVEGSQNPDCFNKMRMYFNKVFRSLQYQCSFASNRY